jgi:ankyrin repeat protein
MGKRAVTLASTDCDGDTALHVLIWRSDTSGAILLIKSGANGNAIGDMGATLLHIAIRKDNRTVVRALIAAGAETDINSEFGATARALAAEKDIDISGSRSLYTE